MESVAPEKLGNLHALTRIELYDLLRRQEKLLENNGFVRRLPDKGAKITALAERIRDVIRAQEDVDRTSELFEKLSMDADASRRGQMSGDGAHQEEEMEMLGAIINRKGGEKTFVDERISVNEHTTTPKTKGTNVWRNSPCEERFIPHKTVHTKSIKQVIPQDVERLKETRSQEATESQTNVSSNKASQPKRLTTKEGTGTDNGVVTKLKYRYDESLEVDMEQGSKKHEASKLIPIEEAMVLQKEQKRKYEEMRTQQAMERLAHGLNMKIGTFDAEGSRKMEYRVKEDEDSDDEPD